MTSTTFYDLLKLLKPATKRTNNKEQMVLFAQNWQMPSLLKLRAYLVLFLQSSIVHALA